MVSNIVSKKLVEKDKQIEEKDYQLEAKNRELEASRIQSAIDEEEKIGCLVLRDMGKYEEAITCYDKALEIDPKYANALYHKGLRTVDISRVR